MNAVYFSNGYPQKSVHEVCFERCTTYDEVASLLPQYLVKMGMVIKSFCCFFILRKTAEDGGTSAVLSTRWCVPPCS
jgi:hypothetical protein